MEQSLEPKTTYIGLENTLYSYDRNLFQNVVRRK